MSTPASAAVSKATRLAVSRPAGAVSRQVQLAVSKPAAGVSRQRQTTVSAPPVAVSRIVQYIVSAPAAAPAPVVAVPYALHRARLYAAHHAAPEFQGRAPNLHLARPAIATRSTAPVPFAGPARLARLIAAHHSQKDYPGRALAAPDSGFSYGGGVGLPARAAALFASAVVQPGDLSTRAAAFAAPVLCQSSGASPVRASSFQAETLFAQADPTFVRAAAFFAEVLTPRVTTPPAGLYPQLAGLSFSLVKTPRFNTGIGTASSGREVRVSYWPTPHWTWDLSYEVLGDGPPWNGTTASDLKTLIGFLLSVVGTRAPFYFQDPDDNLATRQPIGIGDGATTTFVLSRTYGLGQFVGTERVGGVDTRYPVTIYVNGVAQTSGVTVNTATPLGNYLQFASAPVAGAVISATFNFLYWCRLVSDTADFENVASRLWQAKKVAIESVSG